MSDTLDAMKAALEPPKPEGAALVAQLVAEHKAAEEQDANGRINPFDLIEAGGIVKIQNADEADAVAAMIVRADQDLENAKAIADLMVARAKSRVNRLRGIFESALGTWTRGQLQGKKRRSLLLEHAQLGLRKKAAHNHTFCEPDLIAWAERDYVDAVTYKPVVSVEAVKAWEQEHGKPAPGRIHVDESETFKVSIPEAKEEA